MKSSKTHFTRWMALAAGAVLTGGAMEILPGRLAAQEPMAPRPVNNRDLNPQGSDRMAPQEGPRDTPQPMPGQPRNNRSATGERIPARPMMPAPRPPTDVAPARFEAAVYEVQVAENRIVDLEAEALETKAVTLQDLAKALQDFGKTKLLYKIDQTVNLYGENIMLGTREPMVTGTRKTDTGGAINTITYQEVGLIVNLSANPPPPESPRKGLHVQVHFQLSAIAASSVEIAPEVKASSIRNLQLSHSETPRFGKPLVLLNVASPTGGDKAPPVAYVVRYVFRELKP
jgi:hypothetical protein